MCEPCQGVAPTIDVLQMLKIPADAANKIYIGFPSWWQTGFEAQQEVSPAFCQQEEISTCFYRRRTDEGGDWACWYLKAGLKVSLGQEGEHYSEDVFIQGMGGLRFWAIVVWVRRQ